jgi:hypothetical protein
MAECLEAQEDIAMPRAWFYDLIYHFGAPWEIGVRRALLSQMFDTPRTNALLMTRSW